MSDIDLKTLREAAERSSTEWSWGGKRSVGDEISLSPAGVLAILARVESAERRAEEAEKERDALLVRAWNSGFIEASKWPAPHASDVDSAAADEKRCAALAAMAQEGGAETPNRNTGNGVDAGVSGGAEMAQEGGK